MFLVLRKWNLIFIALVMAILCVALGFFKASVPTMQENVQNSIIIDPGHGGMDSGATGISGVVEKDINLKIAMFLKDIAEKDGKTAVLTRTEDTSLHTTDSAKIRHQKRSDLEVRKKILNESGCSVFISIHMNQFEESKYRGAQVFYANNPESKKLGEKIQARLISGLNDGNKRVAKTIPPEVYVLKGTAVPAAIIECGFLSNPEEEKLLNTPEYQQKVAQLIYEGILEFYAN